jgi:hypothetical protein
MTCHRSMHTQRSCCSRPLDLLTGSPGASAPPEPDRILRLPQVMDRAGLARSAFYEEMANG